MLYPIILGGTCERSGGISLSSARHLRFPLDRAVPGAPFLHTKDVMGLLKRLPSRLGRAPLRVRSMPKKAEAFYQSKEWRDLVRSIKATRGAWCERCGSGHRVIGDHIVERRDGGAELDPSNIELLCQPCHNRKTAQARAARVTGGRSKV